MAVAHTHEKTCFELSGIDDEAIPAESYRSVYVCRVTVVRAETKSKHVKQTHERWEVHSFPNYLGDCHIGCVQ